MRTLPSPPPRTPFEELAEEAFLSWARWDPAWATNVGLHAFDSELADPSPEARRAEAESLALLLDRLSSTATAPNEALDAKALRYALSVRHFHVARYARWRRNPDFALEVLDHVFPLLARPFAPLSARLASVADRLDAAPRYFARARGRVDPAAVPPLWVEVALESTGAAPALLDAALAAGAEAGLEAAAMSRLAGAAEAARAAFGEHERWLRQEAAPVAAGEWAMGEELFDELLRVRGVPATARSLVETGRRLVASHRAALDDAAITVLAEAGREPGPDATARALDIVKGDHPADLAGVLDAYRRACADARAFVAKHDLLALAPRERIEVVETPAYLRHLVPFAAYMQPGRFDPEPVGVYLVTPKVDLSAFPHADIRNVTTHEAYPGHHAQLTLANTNPSLARALVEAVETIEGWALYCEEIMGRHGFTAAPRERFIRTRDALFRAARVLIDPSIHIGAMAFDDAVRTLRDAAAIETAEAEAEVKRYTLEPGYQFSYMWGMIGLLDLRRRWEARGGSERGFHDAVTRAGSLPLYLLSEALDAAPASPAQ